MKKTAILILGHCCELVPIIVEGNYSHLNGISVSIETDTELEKELMGVLIQDMKFRHKVYTLEEIKDEIKNYDTTLIFCRIEFEARILMGLSL